jgi:hypothetical protein
VRWLRLLLAYLLGAPFAIAGIVLCVFIGTFMLGLFLLFIAGGIVAWGWMPFIASGAELVGRQQAKYAARMEASEPDYPVEDVIPIQREEQ